MGTMEDQVRAGTSTSGRAPAHQGGHQYTRAGTSTPGRAPAHPGWVRLVPARAGFVRVQVPAHQGWVRSRGGGLGTCVLWVPSSPALLNGLPTPRAGLGLLPLAYWPWPTALGLTALGLLPLAYWLCPMPYLDPQLRRCCSCRGSSGTAAGRIWTRRISVFRSRRWCGPSPRCCPRSGAAASALALAGRTMCRAMPPP